MRSSHLKAVVKKELDSLSGSVRKPFWQYAQLDHDARFGNDYRIIWNLVIGRRAPPRNSVASAAFAWVDRLVVRAVTDDESDRLREPSRDGASWPGIVERLGRFASKAVC